MTDTHSDKVERVNGDGRRCCFCREMLAPQNQVFTRSGHGPYCTICFKVEFGALPAPPENTDG